MFKNKFQSGIRFFFTLIESLNLGTCIMGIGYPEVPQQLYASMSMWVSVAVDHYNFMQNSVF